MSGIDRIRIWDFRGFPADKVPDLVLGGSHLLLYGENGSGKSTLFQALKQLLDVREQQPFDNNLNDPRCLKHRFSDPLLDLGRIRLSFVRPGAAEAQSDMEWRINERRPIDHPYFGTMARTRGLLDYRDILQTHLPDYASNDINLFRLVVETLLRDVEMPASIRTFGEEWEAIQAVGREWIELAGRDPNKMDEFERSQLGLPEPESDEEETEAEQPYDFVQLFREHVEREHQALSDRIRAFNHALPSRVREIEELTNTFLVTFDPQLSVEFLLEPGVSAPTSATDAKWPGSPGLILRASFRGVSLSHPGTFLNEARLTAIALTFFLAALKVEFPESASLTSPEPRLLVLDDVLIGLDMVHRLPVLELVEEQFARKGWQVVLMTFDRAWYEVAKQRVGGGRWQRYELFAVRVGATELPLVHPDEDNLYRALEFLDRGEVKAAAVHIRTEFEVVLKDACERLGLRVLYRRYPEKVSASDLWDAVKAAKFAVHPDPQFHGREHWHLPRATEHRVVPPTLEGRIQHALSWVLNPLSHSQVVDRYRAEVEDAVYAVDELRSAVQHALRARKADPRILLEMLATVLAGRAA
jgi:energy-coupling factor transporter ATP-binding protein EcfA2